MYYSGLFKRKLTVKQGSKLLEEYCRLNGFDGNTSQWKNPTQAKHWFSYMKQGHKIISRNWVCFHYIRENSKYSIWINLANENITEIERGSVDPSKSLA